MRLLFIISSLSSGGAERVLVSLANHFSKKHKIYILTFSNEDSFYSLNKNIVHIKLNLLNVSKSKGESVLNSIKRVIVLKKKLKQINADINISFMTHTNILSIIASKLNNQKIIIAERIAYDFYNSKILNILRRFFYPKANMLITQTIEDKKNYNYLKNVEVVYNPISLSKIENNTKKENIVLAVGRLDKQKGFDRLLETFSKINTNWELCIVGDGVEREKLTKLIKDKNITNIKLIGKRKDVFKLYQKASIFVLSSKKEGFPNVLIEAMVFGCAVISFDCPYGPSEIIENGKNGLLVENQNEKKLKETIELLLNNENLRKKLASEAFKVREKYDMDKIAKQWINCIYKVLSD